MHFKFFDWSKLHFWNMFICLDQNFESPLISLIKLHFSYVIKQLFTEVEFNYRTEVEFN